MLLNTEVLLDHIANYLLFLSDAPSFWFTLNTSYDHPPPSRPLVLLSLCCPLTVSSHWLVVASPLIVPSSCHPLTPLLSCCLALAGCCVNSCRAALLSSRRPPPCPLVVLSLHCPLIISLCRLVVASPSHCPLTAPPSCQLALAGCCVASHRAALSSSCRAVLSSSRCAPAGYCVVSIKRCCHRLKRHPPPPPPPLLLPP
jgi:hypothetical protein